MKAVSGKEFAKIIERHGWLLLRVQGSHHIYGKAVSNVRLSIPIHINTSPSPDGKYVATVYTGMGGGAAGWRYIRGTVNPANEPFSIDSEKKDGKHMVFNIDCSSGVEVKWEDSQKLLVSFKVPSGESGFSVYRKPVDWTRE